MTELSKRRLVLPDEQLLQLRAKLFDITTSWIVVLTAAGVVVDVNPGGGLGPTKHCASTGSARKIIAKTSPTAMIALRV